MKKFLTIAAIALGLLACVDNTPPEAFQIGGKTYRCISPTSANLYEPSNEVSNDIRERLLTPQAKAAGVVVNTTRGTDNNYGNITLYYASGNNGNCVIWVETISLQEYAQRIGLTPQNVSPFYEEQPASTPAAQ